MSPCGVCSGCHSQSQKKVGGANEQMRGKLVLRNEQIDDFDGIGIGICQDFSDAKGQFEQLA